MAVLLRFVSTVAVVLFLPLIAVALRPDYVGETIPVHVELEVGGSVNISCLINPTTFSGENSCEMYFVNEMKKQRVPDKDIVVINTTYIVYMLQNASEQSTRFLCKCGGDAIMESNVYVGKVPQAVPKFDCRSYDFEYMVCNFTQPENPVLTQYNLTYYIDSPNYETIAICNFDAKPLVVCNITIELSYRPHAEEYHFKLHSRNALGSSTQYFNINNLNVMVPARPGDDFRLNEITTNSMEAIWRMPKYDAYTLKGLQWEILLQPDGFPVRNLSGHVRVERGRKLRLVQLPFAYYWYELRLRVKVRTAVQSEDMWSSTFKYRFRTLPQLPIRPPRTDNGSFYVNSLETVVRVYWEQLEKWEYNGDNLTYVIKAFERRLGDSKRLLAPQQLEGNSAVFGWRRDSHYTFEIRSSNHVGESPTASRIVIVPITSKPSKRHTPRSIHNVYHETNRSYTLTWQSPLERQDLIHYTVYWCYSKLALPTDCRGSIHFHHVSRDTQRFSTAPQLPEHEHSLTLAVSANYLDYNTGMHWTSCSVDVNADFEPMEPEVQPISATELRVQWSSKTVCPSILNGYNLTYCEVAASPATDNITVPSIESGLFEGFISGKTVPAESAICSGEPITIIIDKNRNKFNIAALKPFTIYRVEMFMFSSIKVGKPNEPLLVRTYESAPTPPRQLHVSDVTDTSATISWLPPSHTNGRIRQYIVKLNSKEFPVNASAFDEGEQITFVLQNLTSFTSYKAFVIACTLYSSDHSNDIHFTTHISVPSKVNNIAVITNNKMEMVLKWTPPSVPAGPLNYYEVAMTQLRGDYVERRRISAVFGTSCALRVPTCPDRDYQTVIEVRAINAAVHIRNEVNVLDIVQHQPLAKYDPDATYYDGNDDLVCASIGDASTLERNALKLLDYHNIEMYHLYKSGWQLGSRFGCAQRQLGRITGIALSVVCTTLMLVALMFFATKKWKTMSNIKCTLPAALDAYLTKEHAAAPGDVVGGHNGNAGANGGFACDFLSSTATHNLNTPPLHGSRERLHNEEHHLLGTLTNDSGYMGDAHTFGRSISAVATSVAAENHSSEEDMAYRRRDYMYSESSADSLISSTNSGADLEPAQMGSSNPQEASTNAMPLNRIAEESTAYVQASQAADMGGYVTTSNLGTWVQPAATTLTTGLAGDADGKAGYVQATNFVSATTWSQETSPKAADNIESACHSGYIKPTNLPPTTWTQQQVTAAETTEHIQPVCHNGYIKPKDLSAAAATNIANDSAVNSGYIRPADLSGITASWAQQQKPSMAAGYVTVGNLATNTPKFALTPVAHSTNYVEQSSPIVGLQTTSGYVHPNTLQNIVFPSQKSTANTTDISTNASGYTSVDALGKLGSTQPTIAHTMRSQPLSRGGVGAKPNLTGYVTQRELNEYGQQAQQREMH